MWNCFSCIAVRNFLLKIMYSTTINTMHLKSRNESLPPVFPSMSLDSKLPPSLYNPNVKCWRQKKNTKDNKGRTLEELARWIIVAFSNSLNSQFFSTDLDQIGCQQVNEIFVRAFFRLTCTIIRAPKNATSSILNQIQFKISRAIWCKFRQWKARRCLKTNEINQNNYDCSVFQTISTSKSAWSRVCLLYTSDAADE